MTASSTLHRSSQPPHLYASALRPRGLATLTVVMVLFFVMALVAAYANRNLIFEQRVAANSYRAERALAATESGTEWALTLFNSGRVDLSCRPSSQSADMPARDRLMTRSTDGGYLPIEVGAAPLSQAPLLSSCVLSNATLTCVCPTASTPDPTPHAVKSWPLTGGGSAFRLMVLRFPNASPAGVAAIEVQGCGTPGNGATSCGSDSTAPEVDGMAVTRVFLGLVPALPHPPAAALTTGQDADASTVALRISNPDAATGLTVHAGRNVPTPGAGSTLAGPAGAMDDGLVSNDSSLNGLRPTAATRFTSQDTLFRATFGMEAPTYRRQPAVVRINCSAGGCGSTELEAAVQRYPGQSLWFDGDLRIDSTPAGGSLGTATHPVMAIVTGQLSVQAAVDLTGFLYAGSVHWTGNAGTAVLRGGLMAVDDFVADVPATLVYDAAALKTIQQYYGSFVRVPGGWSRI